MLPPPSHNPSLDYFKSRFLKESRRKLWLIGSVDSFKNCSDCKNLALEIEIAKNGGRCFDCYWKWIALNTKCHCRCCILKWSTLYHLRRHYKTKLHNTVCVKYCTRNKTNK